MKILKTVSILAIAGIIGTVAIQAEPFRGKPDGFMQERMEMMQLMKAKHQEMKALFEQLNLTDTQKESIQANRKTMRQEMQQMRKELMSGRDMKQFITVDGVDREAILEKASQNAQKMAGKRVDMMEKTLSILTADQRVKLVELIQAK